MGAWCPCGPWSREKWTSAAERCLHLAASQPDIKHQHSSSVGWLLVVREFQTFEKVKIQLEEREISLLKKRQRTHKEFHTEKHSGRLTYDLMGYSTVADGKIYGVVAAISGRLIHSLLSNASSLWGPKNPPKRYGDTGDWEQTPSGKSPSKLNASDTIIKMHLHSS